MVDANLHPLTVLGIRQSAEQEPPVLMMQDEQGRQLDIYIGLCEALAIQLAINKTVVGRPLTHELFLSIADQLDSHIDHVVIDDVSKGTYYARLIVESDNGEITLDCRPSDGIALALRANIPIFASETVITGESGDDDGAPFIPPLS